MAGKDNFMIYLLAEWQDQTDLGSDRIYNLAQFFTKADMEYTVLLPKHLPFLRYHLNAQAFQIKSIIRLFDHLQGIEVQAGHPLALEDLVFPADVEKVYTPSKVLLLKEGQTVGQVVYNAYGFMDFIDWRTKDGFQREIFDDRGFVSCIHFFNQNRLLVKSEYFNEKGQKTLLQEKGRLSILSEEHAYLSQKTYTSLEDALEALTIGVLENFGRYEKSVLVDSSQKSMSAIPSFWNQIHILSGDMEKPLDSEHWVRDSAVFQMDTKQTVPYIPVFLPQLNLGRSDTMPIMKVFASFADLNGEAEKNLIFLIEEAISDEDYGLIVELEDVEDRRRMYFLQKLLINTHFGVDSDSEEYEKVHEYVIAQKEKRVFKHLEDAIEELKNSPQWLNYVGAVNAQLRIEQVSPLDLLKTEDVFDIARVYVDLSKKYDIQRHVKAVSAGIPILTRHQSDFLRERENGWTISSSDDLKEALVYYMGTLRNWNKSLVTSIDIIEQHEPHLIKAKWLEVFKQHG